MNENIEICQACLSNERLLSPLFKLETILREIEEWKLKLSKGGVCWECRNLIVKFHNFKARVCKAQDTLSHMGMALNTTCLSTMSTNTKNKFDHDYCYYDGNPNDQVEGVPITVKQELIELYNHENPGLNIEIGSPRTERTSDLEKGSDTHNRNGSFMVEQYLIAEKESQNMEHTAEARQVVESMEGVDMQISVNIKTEIEDSNPNSPLELVSEEVQVKDEPVSEGDYTINESYIDDSIRQIDVNLNGTSASELSCVIGSEPARTSETTKEHKKWESSVMLVYKRSNSPKMEVLQHEETEDLNYRNDYLLSQHEFQDDCQLPVSEIMTAPFYPFNAVKQENDTQKRQRRGKDFCLYCRTKVFNFGLHLVRNHWNEENVQKLMSLPTKSKDRIKLREQLKDIGNNLNKLTLSKPVNIKIEDNLTNNILTQSLDRLQNHKSRIIQNAQNNNEIQSVHTKCDTKNLLNEIKNDTLTISSNSLSFTKSNIFIKQGVKKNCSLASEHECAAKMFFEGNVKQQSVPEKKHKIAELMQKYNEMFSNKKCRAVKSGDYKGKKGLKYKICDKKKVDELKFNCHINTKCESIDAAAPTKKCKNKTQRKVMPWTNEQKWWTKEYFKSHIENKKVPKKKEIENLIHEHPKIFFDKDVRRIRVFVQNVYTNKYNRTLLNSIDNIFQHVKDDSSLNNKLSNNNRNVEQNLKILKHEKCPKNPWSTEQIKVIKKHFKNYIDMKLIPQKDEIEDLRDKYPNLFFNKTCLQIKILLFNKFMQKDKPIGLIPNTKDDKILYCNYLNQCEKTANINERIIQKPKKSDYNQSGTVVKCPWTKEQMLLIEQHFKSHIENYKMPKKADIENFIKNHSELYCNKNWLKMRLFIYNKYLRKTKKRYGNTEPVDLNTDNSIEKQHRLSRAYAPPKYDSDKRLDVNFINTTASSDNWSDEQKRMICEGFSTYISNKILPQKNQIENFLKYRNNMFHSKNYSDVLLFLQNSLVTKQKRLKIPWSIEQKLVIEEYFQNHIENSIYPNKIEAENFIKKYPQLYCDKNLIKVQLYVVNASKRKNLGKQRKGEHSTYYDKDSLPVSELTSDAIEFEHKMSNTTKRKSTLINKTGKTRNQDCSKELRKMSWTELQKQVAKEYFKYHIDNKITPSKQEVENLVNENPDLYYNKNWRKIKVFIYNENIKQSKVINLNEKDKMLNALGLVRETNLKVKFCKDENEEQKEKNTFIVADRSSDHGSVIRKYFNKYLLQNILPPKAQMKYFLKNNDKVNWDVNQLRLFLREILNAHLKNNNHVTQYKKARCRWTIEQKQVIEQYFKHHIENKIYPKKIEAEVFLKKYCKLYHNKNSTKVRVFVQNIYTRGYRNNKNKISTQIDKIKLLNSTKGNIKSLGPEFSNAMGSSSSITEENNENHEKNSCSVKKKAWSRWTIEQKQVIKEYFKHHIVNKIYPTKIEAGIFLRKYSTLYCNKNASKVRVYVQNAYNRLHNTKKNKIPTNSINNSNATVNNCDETKTPDYTNSNIKSVGPKIGQSIESILPIASTDNHEHCKMTKVVATLEEDILEYNEDWQKIRLIKYNELLRNPCQSSLFINVLNENANVRENETIVLKNFDDACPKTETSNVKIKKC